MLASTTPVQDYDSSGGESALGQQPPPPHHQPQDHDDGGLHPVPLTTHAAPAGAQSSSSSLAPPLPSGNGAGGDSSGSSDSHPPLPLLTLGLADDFGGHGLIQQPPMGVSSSLGAGATWFGEFHGAPTAQPLDLLSYESRLLQKTELMDSAQPETHPINQIAYGLFKAEWQLIQQQHAVLQAHVQALQRQQAHLAELRARRQATAGGRSRRAPKIKASTAAPAPLSTKHIRLPIIVAYPRQGQVRAKGKGQDKSYGHSFKAVVMAVKEKQKTAAKSLILHHVYNIFISNKRRPSFWDTSPTARVPQDEQRWLLAAWAIQFGHYNQVFSSLSATCTENFAKPGRTLVAQQQSWQGNTPFAMYRGDPADDSDSDGAPAARRHNRVKRETMRDFLSNREVIWEDAPVVDLLRPDHQAYLQQLIAKYGLQTDFSTDPTVSEWYPKIPPLNRDWKGCGNEVPRDTAAHKRSKENPHKALMGMGFAGPALNVLDETADDDEEDDGGKQGHDTSVAPEPMGKTKKTAAATPKSRAKTKAEVKTAPRKRPAQRRKRVAADDAEAGDDSDSENPDQTGPRRRRRPPKTKATGATAAGASRARKRQKTDASATSSAEVAHGMDDNGDEDAEMATEVPLQAPAVPKRAQPPRQATQATARGRSAAGKAQS